jgi:hypothetical protein
MAVSAADVAELRQLEQQASPDADSGLQALETLESVYAYTISIARQNGADEADIAELLARISDAEPPEVRDVAAVLRRLGYGVAAERLRRIAGRRRVDLAPLR